MIHDYNRDTKIVRQVFKKAFISVETASGPAYANDSEFAYVRSIFDKTLASAVLRHNRLIYRW